MGATSWVRSGKVYVKYDVLKVHVNCFSFEITGELFLSSASIY